MDGQQASRLLDLISSVPGGIWTILGLLSVLLVALVSFSVAMWRYGGDIKKLNEGDTLRAFLRLNGMLTDAVGGLAIQSIALKDQKATLENQTGTLEATNAKVVDAFSKLEDVLARLNDDFLPRLNSMSAAVSETKGGRQADAQIGGFARVDAVAKGEAASPMNPSPKTSQVPLLRAGQRYSSMEEKWSMFVAAFKDRVAKTNINWDGRAIGTLAYQLTDRRRSPQAIISLDMADEIAALHGAWKSYNAAKGTMDNWLTAEVQSEFERRVGHVTFYM